MLKPDVALPVMPLVLPHQNKIGWATRVQIIAALPVSLRITEGSDAPAEKRYARLLAVTGRVSALGASPNPAKLEPLLRETEGILSGSLKIPIRPDPIHGLEQTYGAPLALAGGRPTPEAKMPGSYDPIATARLVGRIYATAITDSQRSAGRQAGRRGGSAREGGGTRDS